MVKTVAIVDLTRLLTVLTVAATMGPGAGAGEDSDYYSTTPGSETHVPPPEPCTPLAVTATAAEDANVTSSLDYSISVADPVRCNRSPRCPGGQLYVERCDNEPLQPMIMWPPKKEGSRCVSQAGCFLVRCGTLRSQEVVLPGVNDIAATYTGPFFRSNTLLAVNLKPSPKVRGWKVEVFNSTWDSVGTAEALKNIQNIQVQGTYVPGEQYFLVFTPILKATAEGCTAPESRDDERLYTHQGLDPSPPETRVELKPKMASASLIVVAGVAVFVLALVGYFVRDRFLDPSDLGDVEATPAGTHNTSHSAGGEVLLIHALDTSRLEGLCATLAEDITAHCDRQVVDIWRLTEPEQLEDPGTWLLEKLAVREDVSVVVVLSPALLRLQQVLRRGGDPAECVAAMGREVHPCDSLLPSLLSRLHDLQLSRDYRRLFLVRFTEGVETTEEGDLPELVACRRYLLPQHRLLLLAGLNQVDEGTEATCPLLDHQPSPQLQQQPQHFV
nr:uncharacterized protein LOC123753961 isoform X1 [Procambarus clarkii]